MGPSRVLALYAWGIGAPVIVRRFRKALSASAGRAETTQLEIVGTGHQLDSMRQVIRLSGLTGSQYAQGIVNGLRVDVDERAQDARQSVAQKPPLQCPRLGAKAAQVVAEHVWPRGPRKLAVEGEDDLVQRREILRGRLGSADQDSADRGIEPLQEWQQVQANPVARVYPGQVRGVLDNG